MKKVLSILTALLMLLSVGAAAVSASDSGYGETGNPHECGEECSEIDNPHECGEECGEECSEIGNPHECGETGNPHR